MKTKFNPTKSLKSMSFLWLCPWTPICCFLYFCKAEVFDGIAACLESPTFKDCKQSFHFQGDPQTPFLKLAPL